MTITLITVCRNAANVIAETLDSALAQDYKHIQLVVIDGASTDGTVEILKAYDKKIGSGSTGVSMVLVSEPDKGIYDAMNKGLRLANGDVIGFLNAGDLLIDTQVIGKVVQAFQTSSAAAVYGDIIMVDEKDIYKVHRTWLSGPYDRENFRKGWMPPHVATFIKRNVYDKYGHFNTDLRIGADYEILLRFLYRHKIATTHLPEILVRFRLGGMSNGNLKQILQANREVRRSWKLNGFDAPPLLVTRKLWSKVMQFFK
jgi:glycosyltransferase involved in cell wall biosynthesis